MARKEPRKTTAGAGKRDQSAKKTSSGKKTTSGKTPVSLEPTQVAEPVASQQAAPAATPAPVLTHEQVAERAKQIWQERGCPHGEDERNWQEAEKQLKRELGLQ